MREDMYKLIVERPRRRYGDPPQIARRRAPDACRLRPLAPWRRAADIVYRYASSAPLFKNAQKAGYPIRIYSVDIRNKAANIMHTARVFQSGNSQAVRLPKAFAFKSPVVFIERRGDEIVLRERRVKLSELIKDLPRLPADFPGKIEQPALEDRDWHKL